ncbi:Calcium-binding EF-hand [Cynara cardunculus var. scolymus]|uniref:non-specific serine/threonine protein kinase n=1 Tax=Cynara cardunculus var. scolymus TaxID=59895 RepID=A0A103YBW6_CYNCS|nr:Calcium-binding EF-hand [Cynara cardunculus var. scolymus]
MGLSNQFLLQCSEPDQLRNPHLPLTEKKLKKNDRLKPKQGHQVKRVSSVGLRTDSILQRKTGNLKEFFTLGKKLGQGQFGTTYLCIEKVIGELYACKSFANRKLLTDDDVEDVRRKIQIMHHLAEHPNVISIKGAYEDAIAVHLVMDLCAGGELFDRIVQRGRYTERKAAELTKTIVGVVEACHSLGIMHRDLKPGNLMQLFLCLRELFHDVVGSPYDVAPEILTKNYGPEADGIFEQILHGDLDFSSDPWPSIFYGAKDRVKIMLVRDPNRRLTAHEILCESSILHIQYHLRLQKMLPFSINKILLRTTFWESHPWVQVDGVAPDKPLDSAVITETLSEEEIVGMKQMFQMIDLGNNGQITFDELKVGLKRVGANLKHGTINYGEFVATTLHMNKIEKENHPFAAFSYFDKDESGYIIADEFQRAYVDQDNDGHIDYTEFVPMMQGHTDTGAKNSLDNSFSIKFKEALKL